MKSPFLTQTRTFQRRLFQYALEVTDGDVGWAAGSLGVSETYFRLRGVQLGGVFDLSDVNEDFDNDIWDDVYEDPEVEDETVQLSDYPNPAIPGENLDPFSAAPEPIPEAVPQPYKKPTIAEQPGLISKIDAILNMPSSSQEEAEIVPQETITIQGGSPPVIEEVNAGRTVSRDDQANKPLEVRGRKPAVSPDPNKITRQDVERILGLSTTGVMRLRAKGDLSAVMDPSIDALLFDKAQVEEYAKKRSEAREARRTDS